MALKINKIELINAVGYLDMHIHRIQIECSKNPIDDIQVEYCLVEIQKLLNTILDKQTMTKNNDKYTDMELTSMRIKP